MRKRHDRGTRVGLQGHHGIIGHGFCDSAEPCRKARAVFGARFTRGDREAEGLRDSRQMDADRIGAYQK